MSTPFIGQIKMFGGTFAPLGWSYCDGSLLQISQNDALFNLIGTTYGGDGVTNFGLPDLRGRIPIHQGTLQGGGTYAMGQSSGSETVTLASAQLPAHGHTPNSNNAGGSDAPAGNYWGKSTSGKPYALSPGGVPQALNTATVQIIGGNGSHENMHPYQVLSYIIALEGIYPTPN